MYLPINEYYSILLEQLSRIHSLENQYQEEQRPKFSSSKKRKAKQTFEEEQNMSTHSTRIRLDQIYVYKKKHHVKRTQRKKEEEFISKE